MNTLSTVSSTTLCYKKIIAIIANPFVSASASYAYSASRQKNIACSGRGQYVSYCAIGSIYTSNDYGRTFVLKNHSPFPFTSICMSNSGQYQYVSSNGVSNTESAVFMSNDYGVSFTKRHVSSVSNTSRFGEKMICNSTGQYSVLFGNGNAGHPNMVSINFGVSYASMHDGLLRFTGCMSGTRFLTYESYNAEMRTCELTATSIVEVRVSSSPYGSQTNQLECDSLGNVILLGNGSNVLCRSSDFGTTWATVQGPLPIFIFCYFGGGKVFACSSTTFYRSDDLGLTWPNILYTLPAGETIKSFTGNITYINYITNTGKVGVYTMV